MFCVLALPFYLVSAQIHYQYTLLSVGSLCDRPLQHSFYTRTCTNAHAFYGSEERYVRTYCAASVLLFGWTVFPDVLTMLPIEWIVLTLLCMASVAVGSQCDVVALLQALWFATISGQVSFLVYCTCHQIGWTSVQHVTHVVAHICMYVDMQASHSYFT